MLLAVMKAASSTTELAVCFFASDDFFVLFMKIY